jgi:hypothetical protein
MRLTAIFHRSLQAILDYCALQAEMAERATALEMRAAGELDEEEKSTPRGAAPRSGLSPSPWDEWDQRHMP